ncbi:LytTR family DNA-binding domain-containing protein [Draconibacterium sp.]|nr:LytTR family DNA-binding domain-containing protein [Draconibacterium sp.]
MDKKEFNVLIVDDEPEARFLLSSLLSEIKNVRVIGEADNAEKALYYLVEHYPNLLILDINLPDKSGIELVKLLRKRNVDVPVVFVSAYKEFAIEAIRNEVYDFILKPVDRNELKKVIEKYQRLDKKDLPAKLMEVLNSIKENSQIRLNSNNSYILINPLEIVYCESEDGYTKMYLSNGKTEISNSSLSQIENKIKNFDFYRLGRSILLNKNHIRAINKSTNKCVLTTNETSWEISASRKSIKELLMNSYNYA